MRTFSPNHIEQSVARLTSLLGPDQSSVTAWTSIDHRRVTLSAVANPTNTRADITLRSPRRGGSRAAGDQSRSARSAMSRIGWEVI